MDVYFSPLACSMATRIALYETGEPAGFLEVDRVTKKLVADGGDYRAVNPLGLVPAVRAEDGDLITENAAILQYVGERRPEARLVPTDAVGRARLRQWLSFIATELHKGLFIPLLDRKAPPEAKSYALEKYASRLAFLDRHLTGRRFLLDDFSVADAYLATVLNWTQVIPAIELDRYPAISAYLADLRERPSVARAMAEETALWRAETARHKAA